MTFRKLNARGFSHHFLMALVVMSVGVIGTFMLVAGHADTAACVNRQFGQGAEDGCISVMKGVLTDKAPSATPARYNVSDDSKNGANVNTYTVNTRGVVIKFQADQGITQSGVTDHDFWLHLCQGGTSNKKDQLGCPAFLAAAAAPQPAPNPAPSTGDAPAKQPTAGSAPTGSATIDVCGGTIGGSEVDPDRPKDGARYFVAIDGHLGDVQSSGAAGFNYTIPAKYADGANHQIDIYGQNVDSANPPQQQGTNTHLGGGVYNTSSCTKPGSGTGSSGSTPTTVILSCSIESVPDTIRTGTAFTPTVQITNSGTGNATIGSVAVYLNAHTRNINVGTVNAGSSVSKALDTYTPDGDSTTGYVTYKLSSNLPGLNCERKVNVPKGSAKTASNKPITTSPTTGGSTSTPVTVSISCSIDGLPGALALNKSVTPKLTVKNKGSGRVNIGTVVVTYDGKTKNIIIDHLDKDTSVAKNLPSYTADADSTSSTVTYTATSTNPAFSCPGTMTVPRAPVCGADEHRVGSKCYALTKSQLCSRDHPTWIYTKNGKCESKSDALKNGDVAISSKADCEAAGKKWTNASACITKAEYEALVKAEKKKQCEADGKHRFIPATSKCVPTAGAPVISPTHCPSYVDPANLPHDCPKYKAKAPGSTPNGCFTWVEQNGSLQQAVQTHACVSVPAGTWIIPKSITFPDDRTLVGAGASASDTVLKASPTWEANGVEAVINSNRSAANLHVSNLTVDGNNVATYGIASRGVHIDKVVVTQAKCNGIGISGRGMSITNSIVKKSGFGCPASPPGAGIYGQGNPDDRGFAPVITGNTIVNNGGPGIDMNGINGGKLSKNTITGNTSWAAVSLYGSSNWTVTGNTISQPGSGTTQPHISNCGAGLPKGAGSSGLILCESTTSLNLISTGNTISGNHISGRYGITVIGNDEANVDWVPHGNTIKNNNVTGSGTGCVDDSKKNTWSGNNCSGDANTPPVYY